MFLFLIQLFRMNPLFWLSNLVFWMMLMERRKPFCFQNRKINMKGETSLCVPVQVYKLPGGLKESLLFGEFRELLCEIKVNIKCWYERPGWNLRSTHSSLGSG